MSEVHQWHETPLVRVHATLTRAVSRHCPPWLSDRAEDLVQQALVKLMDSKGDELAELSNRYLWKTAYTVTIDAIRDHRRWRSDEPDHDTSEPMALTPTSDPEVQVHAREIREAMSACLEGLLEKRSWAVTLYLQGHTVAETAKLLDWKTKTADNNLYRGLADLRRCLEKKGMTP